MFVVNIVCCAGTGLCLSPVQRNPTEFGVSECDREASIMRRPWPNGSCWAVVKIGFSLVTVSFGATQFEIPTVSLNEPQINK
jgi:hypothetical protein